MLPILDNLPVKQVLTDIATGLLIGAVMLLWIAEVQLVTRMIVNAM